MFALWSQMGLFGGYADGYVSLVHEKNGGKGRMTECYFCGNDIVFDDNVRSSSGKMIPLESDTREPHNCRARDPKSIPCKYCGRAIYFDPDQVSESGKKIPIEESTHEPHECDRRFVH